MTEKKISKFEELLKLNVNDKVEKKKSGKTELTYLSWAFAVSEMEKAYPEWEYNILEFNGLPYQFDPNTGYLVWTEIRAGFKIKRMWLPVMDGSNKAMKDVVQEYFVKGWNDDPPTKKIVEAATMFDINKTIMRCLVKNIAMFGIGLYIYAGEDLPEGEEAEKPKKAKGSFGFSPDGDLANGEDMKEMQKKMNQDDFAGLKAIIENCGGIEELQTVWLDKKNVAIVNKLKKYDLKLHDMLIAAKDAMKKELTEAGLVAKLNGETLGMIANVAVEIFEEETKKGE